VSTAAGVETTVAGHVTSPGPFTSAGCFAAMRATSDGGHERLGFHTRRVGESKDGIHAAGVDQIARVVPAAHDHPVERRHDSLAREQLPRGLEARVISATVASSLGEVALGVVDLAPRGHAALHETGEPIARGLRVGTRAFALRERALARGHVRAQRGDLELHEQVTARHAIALPCGISMTSRLLRRL
jgi:hypothetical protein